MILVDDYPERIENSQNSGTTIKPNSEKNTKNLSRHSSKEDIPMTNKHMKRRSPSLFIREMQVRITRRYYLTIRIAII